MHRRTRGLPFRSGAFILGATCAILLVTAPAAWAPHAAQLQVTPSQVAPGGEVTVFGPPGFGRANPVEIRLGSPEGPMLGSFRTAGTGQFLSFGPAKVTIPPETASGRYELFATQALAEAETHIRGIPARAVIDVAAPGGVPVAGLPLISSVDGRPDTLARTEPAGVGGPVVVGIGVAGLAMFAAGLAALGARRSKRSATDAASPSPRPATVSTKDSDSGGAS